MLQLIDLHVWQFYGKDHQFILNDMVNGHQYEFIRMVKIIITVK